MSNQLKTTIYTLVAHNGKSRGNSSMKIQTSTVTKINIDETKLDRISVYLENLSGNYGKVVIEVNGRSWAAYWNASENKTIAQFFIDCDNQYLAGCLQPFLKSSIPNVLEIENHMKMHIIKGRRDFWLDKSEARELWDDVDGYEPDFDALEALDAALMTSVFGDEWWYSVPDIENPDYLYLCKVIDVVRNGLIKYEEDRKEREEFVDKGMKAIGKAITA